jgi:kynurenine formamidase
MDKEFPLRYTKREGLVFDVSRLSNQEIDVSDIDMNLISAEMFIAFYTGYIEKELYGTKSYFTSHPQLPNDLIEQLIDRNISIIGIDFAGVKRGAEHRTTDQYCADRGVFIIENLCNLDKVLNQKKSKKIHCKHVSP